MIWEVNGGKLYQKEYNVEREDWVELEDSTPKVGKLRLVGNLMVKSK